MNYNILTNKEAAWPKVFDNMHKPVESLYIRGKIPKIPALGVIGTRRPTEYGKLVTKSLIEPVAAAGVPIISGLAIGIDSLAHNVALDSNGITIAVLPSALDRIYPARHLRLASRIVKSGGALVSEYSPGTKAQKYSFIERNRIIAAMSQVLLVIEATEKSGTMHTVEFANQLGIDVAAVPGPINSIYSKGTNGLIKQGAMPVDSSVDILEMLGFSPDSSQISLNLNRLSQSIIKSLDKQDQTFEQLHNCLRVEQTQLRTELSMLEIQNIIVRRLDGLYARRVD